jgi:hypothetical protein
MSEADYDTYDTEYDAGVTVCYIDEESDAYDAFCNSIIKKVDVIKINGSSLMVNWSDLIERNMHKFKSFTKKYWHYQYENDTDEFMYQWITEIHMYMAGCVSDSFYPILKKFVDSLK